MHGRLSGEHAIRQSLYKKNCAKSDAQVPLILIGSDTEKIAATGKSLSCFWRSVRSTVFDRRLILATSHRMHLQGRGLLLETPKERRATGNVWSSMHERMSGNNSAKILLRILHLARHITCVRDHAKTVPRISEEVENI